MREESVEIMFTFHYDYLCFLSLGIHFYVNKQELTFYFILKCSSLVYRTAVLSRVPAAIFLKRVQLLISHHNSR